MNLCIEDMLTREVWVAGRAVLTGQLKLVGAVGELGNFGELEQLEKLGTSGEWHPPIFGCRQQHCRSFSEQALGVPSDATGAENEQSRSFRWSSKSARRSMMFPSQPKE